MILALPDEMPVGVPIQKERYRLPERKQKIINELILLNSLGIRVKVSNFHNKIWVF